MVVAGQACLSPREWLDDLRRRQLVRPASELAGEPSLVGSGLPKLDQVCQGGLPRGRISEVVIATGGGATVLYALLAAASSRGELAALVDPADGFVAASAAHAGVTLERLLWVRPHGCKAALRAAEVILETGGFGLLVVDLWARPTPKAAVSVGAGMRLNKLAHKTQTAVVVLSARREAGTFSSLTLEVQAGPARWGGRGERFLEGIELSFHLRRMRLPRRGQLWG
jgi:hypothetical protein